MLSCKQVVNILSAEKKLTLRQTIELRAHLFMCKHCANYSLQLKTMIKKLKESLQSITSVDDDRVKDLEEKILKKLKR